jgi:hypothetical protein
MALQQSPLKVDRETDELISHGAHFLHMTKKDLVAAAVRAYLAERREEINLAMRDAMRALDGTRAARLSLLSGIPRERLAELGGVRE